MVGALRLLLLGPEAQAPPKSAGRNRRWGREHALMSRECAPESGAWFRSYSLGTVWAVGAFDAEDCTRFQPVFRSLTGRVVNDNNK